VKSRESRSGKKGAGKKLRLKKQPVRDLDPKQSGKIKGGQGGQPPRGGAKPIEPVG
jgi:hypothetical protein